MIAACAVVMVGMLGLTTDMGRVYIAKNELQAFADAASMAGALKLDGKSTGLKAAAAAGVTGPVGPAGTVNSWFFSTQTVPTPTVTCATNYADAYTDCPSASVDARFVHVLVSANVPMLFLPIVPGVASAITVNASATAGLGLKDSIGNPAPFSPPARDPLDKTGNFGYIPGQVYTLKWPPPGVACGDDATFWGTDRPLGAPDRGLIDLGQGNGAPGIGAILDDNASYPGAWPHADGYRVGDYIQWVPGGKTGPVDKDADTRFHQDTNDYPGTYAQYVSAGGGNRRRLLLVPVNDTPQQAALGNPNNPNGDNGAHVIGFALFFLQDESSKGTVCAEYVGPANQNSLYAGPTTNPTKIYSAYLVQ